MADISKIKTLDGTTYDIKDSFSRNSISSLAMYHRTNCNMVMFGDSWTVGGSASTTSKRYASLVCEMLDMMEYNFGVNAAGFTRSGNTFISQVETANTTMTDDEKVNTGIVSIIGGVNDFRHMDDSGSEISLDTFSTAVITCINRAHAVFPDALIVLGLSNSNLAWYPDTMQHWMSYTARKAEMSATYPLLIIKNLAASVNGVTSNYVSDHLHLTDEGHARFAAHIANAILGGGQDVYYYIGTIVKNSFINSYELEPHLFRENNIVRLTSWKPNMASDFKGDHVIATLSDSAIAPKQTIYHPCYYGDRQIGQIAITPSGNIWFLEQPYNITNPVFHISVPSFTSFPLTVSDSKITTSSRIINCIFSNPEAIIGNVSWSTDTAGKLVLSGSINGSTSIEIDFIDTEKYNSANIIKTSLMIPEISWTFNGAEGKT